MAEEGDRLSAKIGPVSEHTQHTAIRRYPSLLFTDAKRPLHLPSKGICKPQMYVSALITHYVVSLLSQAVPDTKLTLKKYSDAKFEFLVRTYMHNF